MKKKLLSTLLPIRKGKWNWFKYTIYILGVVIYLLKQFDVIPDDMARNLMEAIGNFGE